MSERKPAERRQRRGTADAKLIPLEGRRDTPAPPERVRDDIAARWEAFWSSELAGLVKPSDHEVLRRLFRLYDEIERLWDGIESTGRVVEGSQGQLRPNPLFKQIEAFQAECRQLEDRFGLSPKARLQLGITFAESHRSLSDLNRQLSEAVRTQDDPFAETS